MLIGLIKELKRALREDPFILANRGKISTGGTFDGELFDSLAWRRLTTTNNPFVVQIGAHSGDGSHDIKQQLQVTNAKALLIEPQPDVFQQLSSNYEGIDSVTLANVALSRKSESRQMFRISDLAHQYHKRGKTFGTSIASFDPEHPWQYFLRNATDAGKAIERSKIIETVNVECLTFADSAKRYDISHIDILAVDTEGFDFEVLKMVFESGFRPDLLKYEHKHLCSADEIRQSWKYLIDEGYRVVVVKTTGDSVAVRDHR